MNFTTKELCEIISTCANSEVSEFNYGDLRITFHARKDNGKEEAYNQSPGPVTAISEIFDQSLIQKDELEVKEDELSLLRIEDPLLYEKMLIERELEPGDD